MKKTTLAALISSVSLGLASAANAQESAEVDAVATIAEQLSTLSIGEGQNLEFGTVYKPSGAVAGGACRYRIPVPGNFSAPVLTGDLLADGSPDDADQSNCSQEGSASLAEFTIGCTPGETVSYGVSYISDEVGISFEPSTSWPMRHYDPNGEADNNELVISTDGHDHVCYDGGIVVLRLGGQLIIDGDAEVATDKTVGTIAVDVSYN